MNMDKTYNSMDIKKALQAVDVPIPSESAFRYAKFDSKKAFGRLQKTREIRRALVDGINEYADDLPMELRKQYEKVIRTFKAIEEEEVNLIRFGE